MQHLFNSACISEFQSVYFIQKFCLSLVLISVASYIHILETPEFGMLLSLILRHISLSVTGPDVILLFVI